MDDLDNRARQALDNIDRLSPQVDRLKDRLVMVEDYLSGNLAYALKKSSKSTGDALQSAEDLKQLLSTLVSTILERNEQLSSAHELSVRKATGKTNEDIAALAEIVSMTAASTSALQRQIVSLSFLLCLLSISNLFCLGAFERACSITSPATRFHGARIR